MSSAKRQGQTGKKQPQRLHVTNKSLEAQQFSSVRMPRNRDAVVPKVNIDVIRADGVGNSRSAGGDHGEATAAAAAAFDPIVHDPVFMVVRHSKYWPPPSLEELQKSTGVAVAGGDGFDSYDRREDDARAHRERIKKVKGEINHPRGKPRQNSKITFDDDDDDDDSDSDKKDGNENEEKSD